MYFLLYEFVKLQGEIKTEYANSYYKSGNDDNGIPYLYQSAEDYIGMKGVDWQEETFNPTWSQDHNLSISGGSDNTKYTASFSRYIENGIFKNSGFDKTTGKIRFNQKITKTSLLIQLLITHKRTVKVWELPQTPDVLIC